MRRRDQAILKLNKILKQGHIPCRSFTPYSLETTFLANCFIHSVYNLSDKQLATFNCFEMDELKQHITASTSYNRDAINKSLLSVIKDSGLLVEQVNQNHCCKKNQWIIAYYLSVKKYSLKPGARREYDDYHFMLKDNKSGLWSEKTGPLPDVNKYKQPPLTIDRCSYIYTLQGYYLITNPYLKTENEDLYEKEKQ